MSSTQAHANPGRDGYVDLALPYIPRLLHLVDMNPYSPTYGCFDRSFWHYRTIDFATGMSQEFVLPLALVYKNPYPGNRFVGQQRIREIAEAGMRYMVKASHKDGSCDDYFPYERAMGALVFSLYAATEAYQILGLDDGEILDLFSRRVEYLAKHNETGQLSNHQALAALSAYNVYVITRDPRARKVAEERVKLTLSWQDDEGWFQEYEGADPGYHTCTIDFLAKLRKKMREQNDQQSESLTDPLVRASDFAWYYMHPDGSYGGEYGSRNTYHFYPHGFELLAPDCKSAGQIADAFISGIPNDKRYHNDDDRMTAHYVYDFLQAWEDFSTVRPQPIWVDRQEAETKWFPNARIFVSWSGNEEAKSGGRYVVGNLSKGGVVKVFDGGGPIASDTGLIGKLQNGEIVVTHMVQRDNEISADPDNNVFSVEGWFCVRKSFAMTIAKHILLRLWMVTVGRLSANLTRSIVQRLAITGKKQTDIRFARTISIHDDSVEVVDRVPADVSFKALSVGSDATSIYVANSLTYQESRLCPWSHAVAADLHVDGGRRIWRREYLRRRPRLS